MSQSANRPDTNLVPAAQKWGRQVNGELDRNWTEHDDLRLMIANRDATISAQQEQISSLKADLLALYTATGTTYPPAPPAQPAPPTPPPTQKSLQVSADWSRTWGSSTFYTGGGTYTNATYLYQGQSPENKIGMWHFNVGAAAGKTIVAAEMYLANINSPWAATFVAGFGTHGNVSAPTPKPGRENGFDVGWARGEAKWFLLPSWTYAGLSNGTIQGFTVGGIGPSNPNSAFFQGVGQASPPQLRLTYNT